MQKDLFGNDRYKVGLHIHTNVSDGKYPPEKAAEIYRAAGFDAVAFTDHWVYGEAGEMSGMTVLSGCEYHLGQSDGARGVIHIVGVGMKQDPGIDAETVTRQGIVDAIHAADGLAVWAHPAWSLNSVTDTETVTGFDAVEIYNTVSNEGQSCRPYSGCFVDDLACRGIRYPLVAVDDTHYYDGVDDTKSYIMVKSDSASREDILAAIKRRDFYATQGPELHVRRDGNTILVDCSACVKILVLSNVVWAQGRVVKGERLTHTEYEIGELDRWVRVEVVDSEGSWAWSNIIDVK